LCSIAPSHKRKIILWVEFTQSPKYNNYSYMKQNPAFGKWAEEETNWSQKGTDLIEDVIKEQPVPTSYEELLDEHESSLLT